MNQQKTKFSRRYILILTAIMAANLLIFGVLFVLAMYKKQNQEVIPPAIDYLNILQNQVLANEVNADLPQNQLKNLPEKPTNSLEKPGQLKSQKQPYTPAVRDLNLKLTFYPQAPFADWGMPWQEACEEASMLLIANAYFHHDWSREEFRDQIKLLVDWEIKNLGHYEHTDLSEMKGILSQYFGLESVIHPNPDFTDFQDSIQNGNFVLMPFAGKVLANPYFSNGGPNYHVLVGKGYLGSNSQVITADVGTRRGEDYLYTWDHLQFSLHDFAEPIESGSKAFLEVIHPVQTKIN